MLYLPSCCCIELFIIIIPQVLCVYASLFPQVFHSSNVILVHKRDDLLSCPWKFFNNVILFEQVNEIWKSSALQTTFDNFVTFKKFEMDLFVSSAGSSTATSSNDGIVCFTIISSNIPRYSTRVTMTIFP